MSATDLDGGAGFGVRDACCPTVEVTVLPNEALLVSMALRINHGFGLCDERSKEVQLDNMRKVYEEVVGKGFYSPDKKDFYMKIRRSDGPHEPPRPPNHFPVA